MAKQQSMTRARDRYNRFHKVLFTSPLTMVYTTMYDCDVDLNAMWAEKARIAKVLAINDLRHDLQALKGKWFSKRKRRELEEEEQQLLSLNETVATNS